MRVRRRSGARLSGLHEARSKLTFDHTSRDGPGQGAEGGAAGIDPPGLLQALRALRDAARRILAGHLALLRAELSVIGAQLAVIVGLVTAALLLALLMGVLLYVGTFLFLGEWLFGSMGWGLLHGTLVPLVAIAGIGLNLAGAWNGAFARGLLAGLAVAVGLGLLFASDVLRAGAVEAGRRLEPGLALEPALLPTLAGLVAGAVIVALVALAIAARRGAGAGALGGALVAGLAVGGAIGAVLGSVTFDVPGAFALSITLGLFAVMGVSAALAVWRGIDPEKRYEQLIPRASMAAAQATRDALKEEYVRQKRRVLGR